MDTLSRLVPLGNDLLITGKKETWTKNQDKPGWTKSAVLIQHYIRLFIYSLYEMFAQNGRPPTNGEDIPLWIDCHLWKKRTIWRKEEKENANGSCLMMVYSVLTRPRLLFYGCQIGAIMDLGIQQLCNQIGWSFTSRNAWKTACFYLRSAR